MNEAVKFLKGTQEQFEALCVAGKYQPGAFYLVIDDTASAGDNLGKPGRLYYGVNATNIAPVNQGITTVKTTGGLPTPSKLNAGNFFYAEDENILCISNGKSWVQTNVDTTLNSDASSIDVKDNSTEEKSAIEIEQTIADTAGNLIKQAYTLVGGTNITLTKEADESISIAVSGIDYKLDSSLNNKSLDLGLKNGENPVEPTISITAGDHLNLAETADNKYELTLDNSVDTFNTDYNSGKNEDGSDKTGFNLSISGSAVSGGSIVATLDPVIKYGANGTASAQFKDNEAILNVYTKAEIDNLNRTLNAMVYRGAITTIENNILKDSEGEALSGLHNGDVYIYNGDSDTEYNGFTVRSKDLFIAQGTEDESGVISSEVTWVHIPAGDEPLVEIGDTLSPSGDGSFESDFSIQLGPVDKLLTFKVDADKGLSVNTSVDKDNKTKTVTLGHSAKKEPDAKKVPETLSTVNDITITVNDPTKFDEYGHVLQVTPKEYKIVDTHAVIQGTPHFVNENVLTPAIEVDGATVELAPIEIKSDTLTITGESGSTDPAKNATIQVELQWGTF